MGRILGIDFGTKRTGIAVTDPLQIVVNPLETLHTDDVPPFLAAFVVKEMVDCIVCGHPGAEDKDTLLALEKFVERIKASCPGIPVVFQDESFSSRQAARMIHKAGVPKKQRRNKALVDKISAVLILQEYLGHTHDVHIP